MSDPLGTWLDRLVPGGGPSPTDEDLLLPAELGLQLVAWVTSRVARAHDPALDRDVAVKVSRDDDTRTALRAEAETTARLEHPAVLPVHRLAEVEGRLFLELRWGSGRTLVDVAEGFRAHPPPLVDRLAVVRAVASVLAHAHQRGIVHGDVHPANILVGDEGTWLCDWGASPGVVGHPGYASVARFRGAPPSAEADVYALGVITWELCAGRVLRTRRHEESLGAWVARSMDLPMPVLGGLPAPLASLVAAMTGPTPPTAAHVVATLDAFAEEERVRAWTETSAERSLESAREALVRHRELVRRRAEEERVVAVLRGKVPAYAPALDKRPIREAEDRVRDLAADALETTSAVLDAVARARVLASEPAAADALAAEVWWERLTDAEGAGDAVAAAQARRRLAATRSVLSGRVDAPGTVSLVGDAPGATVEISPFAEQGTRLVPGPGRVLPLPLDGLTLAPGSWLLTVRAPGCVDSVLPLSLGRLQQYRADVRLWTAGQVGDGWCVVPAGPFRMGGDLGARNPLAACVPFVGDRFVLRTCVPSSAYRAFLDDLPGEEAHERCPGEVGLFGSRSHYWTRVDGRWTLPAGWDEDWPVMGVSLADAEAYAAWRSRQEGRVLRVPTEEEWEKASRGVDGRLWPWGNRFDATHCHMRESRPGPPRPAPVGAYPVDCSVYGVLDTAGGMREWTTSTYQEGQRVMRGGTWGDDADDCRCASRAGLQPGFRMPWVSFRLVTEAPRPS